ncbi:MAG: hypothetical protein CVU10_03510 [Bacteroidetes bacterium HGW-Bacteroidetes-5]|jgi:hypothetical protein|nr:MAG: hypothetical protein CVU10_03510 [Bacteroidetes bacterium HGW-Bacteroidetes-5]
MHLTSIEIPIDLKDLTLILTIRPESSVNSVLAVVDDALVNGEAKYQIKEGTFYSYVLSDSKYCLEESEIVSRSPFKELIHTGRISPNIYVGTLQINVLDAATLLKLGEIFLEITSKKVNYRNEYKFMLEEITEKCTELLFEHSSLVSQFFKPNYKQDPKVLYQRFAFVKSIIDSNEFDDSVNKILTSPVTRWTNSESVRDIRGVRRMGSSQVRQICSSKNRANTPDSHFLKEKLNSLPLKLSVFEKSEIVDTPENRFIKHALSVFQRFCNDISTVAPEKSRLKSESSLLDEKLLSSLSHSIFKEISAPKTLPLNSPILQRKEGYREILKVWLMFDLAASLSWDGGEEDVYKGGKKDVATLYEYWLFFKLLELVEETFGIIPPKIEELISISEDKLGLTLKQGRPLHISGIYTAKGRQLNIQFSYNKSFEGGKSYPSAGSWTRAMRPDYTLSFWPSGLDLKIAEEEELVVHVHFDAKYRVEKIEDIVGSEDNELNEEKRDNAKGIYKRADLLKMHAYKDAIRRTAGAYVLYPGENGKKFEPRGFHEIIPGLGAFAVRPSKVNNGTTDLKKFLESVADHLMNRASQREKISYHTYDVHKTGLTAPLNASLPEPYGKNRSLIPDNTNVIIGYYRKENWGWIENKLLYNLRDDINIKTIGPRLASAKFLLLHTTGDKSTDLLYRITSPGPEVKSKEELITLGYINPSEDYYFVFEIEPAFDSAFAGQSWDLEKLCGTPIPSKPMVVSLTELMRTAFGQSREDI